MNQSAITCFLSAARTGSFSETARELYMTRQAVSKNIQELEEEVGFPLFFPKKTVPLVLTTAGEKMRSYYLGREYDLGVAERIFSARAENTRTLRVGWGRWFMPNSAQIDALAEYNATKGVKLSVVSGTEQGALEYLRTGEADVAFLSKYVCSMIKEPYTAVALAEQPLLLGLSEQYGPEAQDHLDEIVRATPYLTCPAGETDDREILGRVYRGLMYFDAPPSEIRILPNVETVLLQVMLGHGFTCMPNALRSSPHIHGFDLPPRGNNHPSVTMCMVWLNRNQNEEILRLRDWMLEQREVIL